MLILIGSIFHKSILFGLTFPIFNYFFNKKYFDKLILVSIFILPLFNTKTFLDKIFVHVLSKNSVYLMGVYSNRNNYMGVYYSLIFLVIVLFFSYYFKKSERLKLLKNIFIYSTFISSSLFYYGDISGRLSSFFNVEFVMQDKFIDIFKNKIFIKVLMIIFLVLLFKINFINRVEKKITPYKLYFNEKVYKNKEINYEDINFR